MPRKFVSILEEQFSISNVYSVIRKLTVTNATHRLRNEVARVKYCTNSEKGSWLRPKSLRMMQDKVNWVIDSEIASKNATFLNNVVVFLGNSGIP